MKISYLTAFASLLFAVPASCFASGSGTFVLVPNGDSSSVTATGAYDFGRATKFDPSPIQHDFVLRNAGASAVTVEELTASCGCTTGALIGDGPEILPVTVPSGSSIVVRVTIDPTMDLPGFLDKTVWVRLEGDSVPVTTLEMKGTLLPAAVFSPAQFELGSTAYPNDLKSTFSVDWTGDSLAPGDRPQVTSTDPDVSVAPSGDWKSINPVSPQIGGVSDIRRTYLLTVSGQRPLGPLTAAIRASLPPAKKGGPELVVGKSELTATEIGGMSSLPGSLTLRTKFGEAAASGVVLIVVTRPDLRYGLTVKSDSSLLSGSIGNSQPLQQTPFNPVAAPAATSASTPAAFCVPVTITAQPSRYGYIGHVLVTAADGEQTVVRVQVDVPESPGMN